MAERALAMVRAGITTARVVAERLTPIAYGILSDLWRLDRRKGRAFGKNVEREAEKKAIETARYVIPIACHTAMVYTVSGLVLHRLRRMARAGDAPREARSLIKLVCCTKPCDCREAYSRDDAGDH